MQKSKTIRWVLAVAATASLLALPGARAWGFMSSSCDTAKNAFTVADCKTSIVEDFVLPDRIEPGCKITKQVSVRNDGSAPCFVRTFVGFVDGNCKNWAEIDFSTGLWELDDDGYRYYTRMLEPGETSEPVCTEVEISPEASQVQIQDFDIIAFCESTPAKRIDGTPYSSAKEAFVQRKDLQ